MLKYGVEAAGAAPPWFSVFGAFVGFFYQEAFCMVFICPIQYKWLNFFVTPQFFRERFENISGWLISVSTAPW